MRGRPKQTAQRSTGGRAPHKDLSDGPQPVDDFILPFETPVPVPLQPQAMSLSQAVYSNLVSIVSILIVKSLTTNLVVYELPEWRETAELFLLSSRVVLQLFATIETDLSRSAQGCRVSLYHLSSE